MFPFCKCNGEGIKPQTKIKYRKLCEKKRRGNKILGIRKIMDMNHMIIDMPIYAVLNR